jgi:hypothetical protein
MIDKCELKREEQESGVRNVYDALVHDIKQFNLDLVYWYVTYLWHLSRRL